MNMKSADKKHFFAKVLLFGEYSVILDGEAIIIPLKKFSGFFDFAEGSGTAIETGKKSNSQLKGLLSYLKNPDIQSQFHFRLDLEKFEEDLQSGMFFNSNIPQGYGAGSSGAIIAALFYHYLLAGPLISEKISNNLSLIKKQLALMESYFHGSSSGLDPMSSLLGEPFRMDAQKRISFPDLPLFSKTIQKDVFLIDTGHAGDTLPLVNWFKEQVARKSIDDELLKALNNQVVQALLSKNLLFFESFLSQLSLFQLENMKPMIPEKIQPLWQKGIDTGKWTFKLCGSGGGGYMLGFADHYENAKKKIENAGFKTTPLS